MKPAEIHSKTLAQYRNENSVTQLREKLKPALSIKTLKMSKIVQLHHDNAHFHALAAKEEAMLQLRFERLLFLLATLVWRQAIITWLVYIKMLHGVVGSPTRTV